MCFFRGSQGLSRVSSW